MAEDRDLEAEREWKRVQERRISPPPLFLGKEDDKRILLKCFETSNWRKEYLCNKWLGIQSKDVAYKKIISCINVP
jgi:hypothetical protein